MSPLPRGHKGAAIVQAQKLRADNRTGYKGVLEQDGRWRARLGHRSLGLYDTAEDAARAYDLAALALYGPGAWTNAQHTLRDPR